MAETSTNLLLPYLQASQAQKHVTHNEALRLLDGLVQLSVHDRDLAAPPASPADGDRYLVAAGATGEWAGWDLNIAYFVDGAWMRLVPRPGWRAWIEDESALMFFDGAAWTGSTVSELQNVARLGVGTTADAANPVSARLNAALWTALTVAESGSGDLRTVMNKEAAGNTVSLLFQDAWSGRAELGLAGDDSFRIKVSADGAGWRDAIVVDPATGDVDLPNNFSAYSTFTFTREGHAYLDWSGDSSVLLIRRKTSAGTEYPFRVDPPGTSAPQPTTGITREKGDDRYTRRGVNVIGGAGFCRLSAAHGGLAPGDTVAGSDLEFASVSEAYTTGHGAIAPAGTWLSLAGCAADRCSLFERTA